jgi:hypothetical protein
LTQVELWSAIASSRLDRCEGVLPRLPQFADLPSPSDRIALALTLGRCHREDEAMSVLLGLESSEPLAREIIHNLQWIKGIAWEDRGALPAALRWSRARTMLFDRGGAFRALVPFRETIVADRQGLVFFARTAWAAGEDAAARQALTAQFDPPQVDALLTTWSRELDRAP